jgi:acyl-coenzyme A synthetase/AMP-(fatty) acid ligase
LIGACERRARKDARRSRPVLRSVDEAGEVPKAFIVPHAGRQPDPGEVMAYVAARVAPHMQVRACELIDAIPKSPSGKLLRRVLAERERAARA